MELQKDLAKLPKYFQDLFGPGKNESFDPDVPFVKKPSWYNEEKFKKGQEFAKKNLVSICYAEIVSLFLIFAPESALEPLIFTDKSNTPYRAFERYLSTLTRIMSWYEEDPWKDGTISKQHMITVRKMHRNVQTKFHSSTPSELQDRTTLDGRFPMGSTIRPAVLDDFRSNVSATDVNHSTPGKIRFSQYEMAMTQFGFVAMVVTYPQKFGIHYATDEDLESFTHVWRTIGYLLGIRDRYNFCNADLKTIQKRTHDSIDYVFKPALRNVSTDWEQMCQSVSTGVAFYLPLFSFEASLAHLCSILNIPMPRLMKNLSIWEFFLYFFVNFTFNVLCKIPGVQPLLNGHVERAINHAKNASPETLKKWQEVDVPYIKSENKAHQK